jgi:hypothetical protein
MTIVDFDFSKITKAAGVLAAVGAVIGAFLTVDDRYAHAVDLEKYQVQQSREIYSQLSNSRAQMIEDKLFELESKQFKSAYDKALIERYKRILQDIKSGK